MNWVWVQRRIVLDAHAAQIAEHGGLPGVRDQGALDAALARPENKAAYGEPTVLELAAAYAYGIACNHPFSDGNKRTAFIVSALFLDEQGFAVEASKEEIVRTFLALAAGEMTEEALADWFRSVTIAQGG